MSPTLADRMLRFVVDHDRNVRAAVHIATSSILARKIGAYVEADGWVEWDRLAAALAGGLPWSSGEKRLARLTCSLVGQIPDGEDGTLKVQSWTLSDMLTGLDDRNAAVAAEAITLAATGRMVGGVL